MRELQWELLVEGLGRLEAPCIDLEGRLCFSDRFPKGRIVRLEQNNTVTALVERTHVGGLVAHVDGGLVASGHSVVAIGTEGSERLLLEPGSGWGFNDLGTDPAGRVFVGRFDVDPLPPASGQGGSLWRVDERSAVQCYDGIQLTNGIGVAPDGSRLYHNDTTPRTVWVSDLDEGGMPVKRRCLHQFTQGNPDGMAIDEAGCIWVVLIGSGQIARITPDGAVDQVYRAPRDWTASICFDGGDLYAVTFGGEPYDPGHSGAVFRAHPGVGGAPVQAARV
jgi:xylono-1,5-lactonase